MADDSLVDLLPQIRDSADKLADSVEAFLSDHGSPGWVSTLGGALIGGIYFGFGMLLKLVIAVLVRLGAFFATNVLTGIDAAKKDNADQFNQVIAASLSEFLGVDIAASDLPSGAGPQGASDRNAAIGGKLQELLAAQFGGLREIAPADGATNAKVFTGFALNYAISASFIGILAEAESLGFLKNFKDLGEDTASALGLGRMTRLALQPLIRNMIQQPYDLFLRSQTRPDRLTEQQYIHGFHHGDFDETFLRAKLAEKGYPEAEINRLILELTTHLAEADIERLIRYGDLSQDDGVAELNVQGIPSVTAQRLIRATEISRADSIVSSYVNKIESQYINGFIDETTFMDLLDRVPWSDEEKQRERDFVGVTLDAPQTTLTFTQVKAGIVGGILDLDYLDQWSLNQGYSDTDQLYLEFDVLQALNQQATKDQIAAAKAARAAAKAGAKVAAPTITRS